MKGLHALALCAVLAGCSTVPVALDKATTPSASNVRDASVMLAPGATPAADEAALQVVRDAGPELAACAIDFFVDDAQVATLHQGDGFMMRLKPGAHRARIEVGGFICPLYSSSIAVVLAAGQKAAIRIGVDDMRPFIRVQ